MLYGCYVNCGIWFIVSLGKLIVRLLVILNKYLLVVCN